MRFSVFRGVLLFLLFLAPLETSPISNQDKIELNTWFHCIIQSFPKKPNCGLTPNYLNNNFFNKGIFVTFYNKEGVRGCFGAFEHIYPKLEENLYKYIQGAMEEDYRYPPISKQELIHLNWQITIAESPELLQDFENLSPKEKGYIYRNETTTKIYVPGEISNKSYLKKLLFTPKSGEVFEFKAIVLRNKNVPNNP